MSEYFYNRYCRCMRCSSRGVLGPIMLITLGVLFLLEQSNVADFEKTWPLLLIVPGVVLILQSLAPSEGHTDPGVQSQDRQVTHV